MRSGRESDPDENLMTIARVFLEQRTEKKQKPGLIRNTTSLSKLYGIGPIPIFRSN